MTSRDRKEDCGVGACPPVDRVGIELLKLYVANHRHDLIAVPVMAAAVAIVLGQWLSWELPAGWAAAMLAASVAFDGTCRRFAAAEPEPAHEARWIRRIAATHGAVILLWASLPVWAWQPGVQAGHLFILMMMAGGIATVAAMSGPHLRLCAADMAPLAVAGTLRPALEGDLLDLGITLVGLMFTLLMVRVARQSNAAVVVLIGLRLEKEDLVGRLADSERRLRSILNALPWPITIQSAPPPRSAERRLLFVNGRAAQLFGRPPEELIGTRLSDDVFVDPEDRRRLHEKLEAEGSVVDFETRLSVEHGSPIWALLSVTRMSYGGERASLTAYVDITEREDTVRDGERRLALQNVLLKVQQQASPDGIVAIDFDGQVLSYNDRFLALWGLDETAVKHACRGQLNRLLHPKIYDPERADEAAVRAYHDPSIRIADDLALKDGRVFERHSSPLVGEDGAMYGRIWFFRDVTQRRALERSLVESEQRFRDLIEGSVQGIIIVRPDGRPVFANQACARIFGCGAPVDIVALDTADRLLVPGEAGRIAALRHREADERGAAKRYRFQALRRDGAPIWLDAFDRSIRWMGEPAIQTTLIDVTAEVAAHRTERLLREAIDCLDDGLMLLDADQRVVLTNRQHHAIYPFLPPADRIVGRSLEDLLRLTFGAAAILDPLAETEPERWLAERLQRQRAGESLVSERRHRDGRWYLVKERVTPDGGTVALCVDITQRKAHELELEDAKARLEDQATELADLAESLEQARQAAEAARRRAEEANRAKSEFIALTSHELRTPLNAISGFAEMLQQQYHGPLGCDKYREYCDDILASTRHLTELMNDILDLSRVEAGRYELQEAPVDLRHSVASALRLVAQRAQNKGVVLSQQIDPVPAVLADERALRQVLVNLLANAVKFTPRGGRVEAVVAAEPAGGVAIVVRDTGIGIPRADLSRVLEPFAQASNTRYNGEIGTGLGLSIVRSLLALHGGTVEITSELGKGTMVTARLPKSRVLGPDTLEKGEPKAAG